MAWGGVVLFVLEGVAGYNVEAQSVFKVHPTVCTPAKLKILIGHCNLVSARSKWPSP